MGAVRAAIGGISKWWRVNQTGTETDPHVPVVDAYIQDQTTPVFVQKANQVVATSTLAAATVIDDYSFEVADATGFAIGQYLGIFCTQTDRYYAGHILNVVGTTITMDIPIDSAMAIGALVGTGISQMAVDGSVTPEIFKLRGADPGVDITFDVTHIIITCITTSAILLTGFGDIAGGLTRGLLIRHNRTDGKHNIAHFRTNMELKGHIYTWEDLDDVNPGLGYHGFVGKMSFAGRGDMGVAIRVGPGESLDFVVQDDLTDLLSLEVVIIGHEVY